MLAVVAGVLVDTPRAVAGGIGVELEAATATLELGVIAIDGCTEAVAELVLDDGGLGAGGAWVAPQATAMVPVKTRNNERSIFIRALRDAEQHAALGTHIHETAK